MAKNGQVFSIILALLFVGIVFHTTPAKADVLDCEETPDDPLCKGIEEASKRYGGCSDDPFPYIEKRHNGNRTNSFVTPTTDGRRGLDTALACRLKKLLEFSESKGCRFLINSAMRPKQQCNPNGGACARQGNSCHQYGRAVDLAGSPQCLAWLTSVIGRQNGNSPFKLQVAYLENGNYRHVQCSEHPVANASSPYGCRSACTGGISINPGDLSNIPDPGSISPSSGITGAARDLLGQREQMCALPDGTQVPCSAIANRGAQQQQPLAQGQQPQLQQAPPLGSQNTTPYAQGTCPPQFYCANSTYYYRSSSCVDQVYQKCPAGCSASSNACAATSSASLSVIDQIGLIAEPTTTPTGAVSDLLFELAISGEDIATLQDKTAQNASLPGDTSYGVAPPLSQQTFVSGDLRYSQAQYQPQLSALQRTLATMKDTLLHVLAYLRPFGRFVPADGEYE